VVDDITAEIITPIVFAVDRIAGYQSKPEIGPERLIAWGSATEDHFTDLLLNWAQASFPDLFKGAPVAGVVDGYRFRYYAPTQTYVAVKQGQVYLYQPAVNPQILPLGPMVQWLPQALNDLQRLGVMGLPGPKPRAAVR
jgi:hypothetical protein